MANTLIIDGNSIGHASHNATKLSVGDFETQAIFGTIKSIRNLAEMHPNWNNLVLWDGKSHWRFALLPEYKGTRVAKDAKEQSHKDSYQRQLPFIRKALQMLGVRQLLVVSAEADDMAGLMTNKITSTGSAVKLISGDKDWIQLVRRGVIWFDPIRDRKVNIDTLFEATGYRTVEGFVDGKALMGDSSDNIKGVGGIGEKGAPEFIAEFGSVAKFFEQVDSGVFVPKKKAHQGLASPEGRALFERNRKLMNLLDVPVPPKEDVQVIQPTSNPEGFRALCEKLNFASILRDFDLFLKPFTTAALVA